MKLSKFDRSQKAHTRLFNKHVVKFGYFDSYIKSDYHSTVLDLQRQSKITRTSVRYKFLDALDKSTRRLSAKKTALKEDGPEKSHLKAMMSSLSTRIRSCCPVTWG